MTCHVIDVSGFFSSQTVQHGIVPEMLSLKLVVSKWSFDRASSRNAAKTVAS